MIKNTIAILFFSLSSAAVMAAPEKDSVHEEAYQHAVTSAVVDVGTTAVGLAMGATELAPLGLTGALAVKLGGLYLAQRDEAKEYTRAIDLMSAIWYGASANNICTIFAGPSCAVIGAITGAVFFMSRHKGNEKIEQVATPEKLISTENTKD